MITGKTILAIVGVLLLVYYVIMVPIFYSTNELLAFIGIQKKNELAKTDIKGGEKEIVLMEENETNPKKEVLKMLDDIKRQAASTNSPPPPGQDIEPKTSIPEHPSNNQEEINELEFEVEESEEGGIDMAASSVLENKENSVSQTEPEDDGNNVTTNTAENSIDEQLLSDFEDIDVSGFDKKLATDKEIKEKKPKDNYGSKDNFKSEDWTLFNDIDI